MIKESEEKKEAYWIRYIHNRIARKKNFLVQISGPTGSGKSWSALSIALELDKNFGPDRIVFGLKGLMELINSEEKYKAGTVFVWDEFQIEAGSRNWQSLANKLLNSLLSTFRHRNFILIITAPYMDFIDSQSRKLLHAEFITRKIDFNKKVTVLKPQLLQYNSRNRKFYYKYLRISTDLGPTPVVSWSIHQPPKWLIEEYERMKTQFTTKLNKEIELQLTPQDKSNRKPLTNKQKEVLTLMAKYGDVEKVSEKSGLNIKTIYFHIAQARKKGHVVEEFV